MDAQTFGMNHSGEVKQQSRTTLRQRATSACVKLNRENSSQSDMIARANHFHLNTGSNASRRTLSGCRLKNMKRSIVIFVSVQAMQRCLFHLVANELSSSGCML